MKLAREDKERYEREVGPAAAGGRGEGLEAAGFESAARQRVARGCWRVRVRAGAARAGPGGAPALPPAPSC